jgi:phage-related protein
MAELEETGVRLVAEDSDTFSSNLNQAADATTAFDGAAAAATGGISVFGEIAVGALREIGSIAVDALGSAAQAAIGFFQDGFASAGEAEQQMVRINTLLKNGGDASGLTSEQVQNLATKFMDLAGGTDDTVLAIEEMGLRMGNISADQMPSFIQNTLDLAAATGTDATNAARLFAQAQEDPISALGRFKKMGILVDEQTKAQIKSMQDAGDTAGAFALLMDRVGQATGGSAAAQAQTFSGRLEILKGHIGEAGEAIFSGLLPPLETLFQNVITPALPLIDEMSAKIGSALAVFASGDIVGGLEGFGAAINVVIPGATNFFYELAAQVGKVIQFFQAELPLVQGIATSAFSAIGGAVQSVAGFFTQSLLPAIQTVTGDAQTEMPSFKEIFENVMHAVGTAITIAANFITNVLVPAATAAVAWFVTNWPQIKATAQAVFDQVQSIIQTVMPIIQTIISTVLTAIQQFWDAHGAAILTILSNLWALVQTNVQTAMTFFQNVITVALNLIHAFWDTWGTTIMAVLTNMWDAIQNALEAFADIFKGDWEDFGERIRAIWDDNWENVKLILTNAVDALKNMDWGAIGTSIMQGIANGITAGAEWIKSALLSAASAAWQAITGFFSSHSPSLKFAGLGQDLMEGLSMGITGNAGAPVSAMTNAAMATFAPAAMMTGAVSNTSIRSGGNASFGDVHINNGMDQASFEARVRQVVQGMI